MTRPRPVFPPAAWPALLLPLAGLLAGCGDGPPLASVEGKVLLDGKPLANATVEFTPAEGSPSYGTTDGAGRYELRFTRDREGAMLGNHLVRITTYQDEGANGKRVREKLPARYHLNSELMREVKSGGNTIDFALTSAGKAGATAQRRN